HELKLTRNGVLNYLERYSIVPSAADLRGRWIAGDACYFGTLLAAGTPGANAERIHAELQTGSGVLGSADVLERDLLLVRLMARSGVAFHDARARAVGMLQAG